MRLEALDEKCAACGVCELTCALTHFKVNNPKKSAIRAEMLVSKDDVKMRVKAHVSSQTPQAAHFSSSASSLISPDLL